MSNQDVTKIVREHISSTGLKLVAVATKSGVPYQRLQRVFNQNAVLSASELLMLCKSLGLSLSDFIHTKEPIPPKDELNTGQPDRAS